MLQEDIKTVYFDHNALIEIIEKRTDCFFLFDSGHNIRVVASLWNLYEITGSLALEQALNLAKYLDKDNVYWLQDKRFIQSQELQAFIYTSYYSFPMIIENPIRMYISEALATLNDPTSIIVNFTPSKLVKAWHKNKSLLVEIETSKEKTVIALKTMQQAKKNKGITQAIHKEIQLKFLRGLFPRRNPQGRPILEDELNLILDYCICNIKHLYKMCPAIQLEYILAFMRASDPKRKPEKKDAPDLQHAVSSIAYCDYFFTKERFLTNCAKYAVKHCKLRTKIISSISELVKIL